MYSFQKLLIIAEIGSVHDGSFGNACKLVELAAECGASAVKFQLHDPENETLIYAPNPPYFKGENRFQYFKRTSFSIEQLKKLKQLANKLKLKFIVSPFSIQAAKKLNKIGVDGFKIASGELSNHPMLNFISGTKKYIFLSTGMSNWKEINDAMKIFRENKKKLTIFQCTSQYPCEPKNVGINILEELKKYKCDIGLSDHTEGYAASISAIANGCNVIEKHITFSKKMYGSDAKHSMEPQDFKIFCKEIKESYLINNSKVNKDNLNHLKKMRLIFQKSIYIAKDLKKGSKLSLECMAFLKPGNGILASDYKKIVGKTINKNLKKNHRLRMKDFIK